MTDVKNPEAPETTDEELSDEELDEASGGVLMTTPTLNTKLSSIKGIVAPTDLNGAIGPIDVQGNQMPSNNGVKL